MMGRHGSTVDVDADWSSKLEIGRLLAGDDEVT